MKELDIHYRAERSVNIRSVNCSYIINPYIEKSLTREERAALNIKNEKRRKEILRHNTISWIGRVLSVLLWLTAVLGGGFWVGGYIAPILNAGYAPLYGILLAMLLWVGFIMIWGTFSIRERWY